MTDAEFWECMAISVEAAQTMPDHFDFGTCPGLCSLVDSAFLHGLINEKQFISLIPQIRKVRPQGQINRAYFWKPGAWRPRVRAMYKLAKLAKGKQ